MGGFNGSREGQFRRRLRAVPAGRRRVADVRDRIERRDRRRGSKLYWSTEKRLGRSRNECFGFFILREVRSRSGIAGIRGTSQNERGRSRFRNGERRCSVALAVRSKYY